MGESSDKKPYVNRKAHVLLLIRVHVAAKSEFLQHLKLSVQTVKNRAGDSLFSCRR